MDAEIYAHYGRTMHEAQLCELSIQGLAVQLELEKGDARAASEEQAFDRVDHLFHRTIGWVQARDDVPDQIAVDAEWARLARNDLAHHYLREANLRLRDGSSTPDEIMLELDYLAERFQELGERIDSLVWDKLGVDPEEAQRHAEETSRELGEQ